VTCIFGGHTAVDRLNLDIAPGEFVSLLGPSGCGKTTTLRMIAGFIRPTGGTIAMDGEVISAPGAALPPEKRGMSMIFQSYAIWPNMTVAENVAFGLKLRRFGREAIRAKVAEMLETVRLGALADRYPAELSGGQQQRVACARALLHRPEVIFADEPTGNLDSRSGGEVLGFLRTSVREMGQTIVMVTHDPVAASYADRVVFLRDGRITAEMFQPTPESVLDSLKRLEA
jgi:ABC-type Fe3+/spermidine/putrescine transport system ATPase subunit